MDVWLWTSNKDTLWRLRKTSSHLKLVNTRLGIWLHKKYGSEMKLRLHRQTVNSKSSSSSTASTWDRSRCRQISFMKTIAIYTFGRGCTVAAAPRTTQPSTLCGKVKWVQYQLYGWVILQVTTNEWLAVNWWTQRFKFPAWPMSWQPAGANQYSFKWSE